MHLLHVSIIVSDLKKAAEFYGKILGLERDHRPYLGFEGLFYKLGSGQQLHLMCTHNPYQTCKRPEHGGRDRHIALAGAIKSAGEIDKRKNNGLNAA